MARSPLPWLSMLLLLGCGRAERPEPRPSPTSKPRERGAPTATTNRLAGDLVRPPRELVIAMGDLHGDLETTRAALRLAGAIDGGDRWVGGRRTIVQTGDSIDRGDDDRAVIDLLVRLRDEAHAAGGELILLSGNHELMNVAHDFRYATEASTAAFASEGGRHAAFAPGGPYARKLATYPTVVQVGDSVFVHGGVLEKHVAYGLNRLDEESRAWMRGERPALPSVMTEEEAPVWSRRYSTDPADCEQLRRVLGALGARRMIVGHTVQQQGINAACDGLVYRIDVGLSRHYGGRPQVLELRGENVRIRSERALGPAPREAPAPSP